MSKDKHNYDPGGFTVPGLGRNGRIAKVRFRMNSENRKIVEAIVSSGRFAYRYPCDFYRHAVRVLIKQLSCFEDVDNLVAEYQLKIAAQRTIEAQRYRLTFEDLKQEVERLLSSGKRWQARRSLLQFAARMRSEPHGFWRDCYLDKVRETWGPLLEGVHCPTYKRHELLPGRED